MKAKTCQYCHHAKEATASSRTILICNNKYGCEAKFFVVAPDETCANFKLVRTRPSSESDGAKLIPVTQGRFAIVDAEDYDWLSRHKWHSWHNGSTFYAFRRDSRKGKTIIMHRAIMQPGKGMFVDHIDGDGLNNRKSNLRVCSLVENARNRRPARNCSSRYKGVGWDKWNKKWRGRIFKSGTSVNLGSFDDEIEAARAYDRKAEDLFGEFAYLNFGKKVIGE